MDLNSCFRGLRGYSGNHSMQYACLPSVEWWHPRANDISEADFLQHESAIQPRGPGLVTEDLPRGKNVVPQGFP